MQKALFRDKSDIDFKKDKEYVIEKILRFGDQKDFFELKNMYSIKEIISFVNKRYYNLDDITRNFFNTIYKTNLPLTKCRNEFTSNYSLRFKKKIFVG